MNQQTNNRIIIITIVHLINNHNTTMIRRTIRHLTTSNKPKRNNHRRRSHSIPTSLKRIQLCNRPLRRLTTTMICLSIMVMLTTTVQRWSVLAMTTIQRMFRIITMPNHRRHLSQIIINPMTIDHRLFVLNHTLPIVTTTTLKTRQHNHRNLTITTAQRHQPLKQHTKILKLYQKNLDLQVFFISSLSQNCFVLY